MNNKITKNLNSQMLDFQNSKNVIEIFEFLKQDNLLQQFTLEKQEKVFPKIEQFIRDTLTQFEYFSKKIDECDSLEDFQKFIKNDFNINDCKGFELVILQRIFKKTTIYPIEIEFYGKNFPNTLLEFYNMKRDILTQKLHKFYHNPTGKAANRVKKRVSDNLS